MQKNKLTLIITVVATLLILIFGTIIYFVYNSNKELEYTPAFKTTEDKQVDIELIQVEDKVYLYAHKERTGVDSLEEFNAKYEVIEYNSTKGVLTPPVKEIAANDEYITLGYSDWQNVYCMSVFENKAVADFAVGRVFKFLASPSEAWMCEGIEDMKTYPSLDLAN